VQINLFTNILLYSVKKLIMTEEPENADEMTIHPIVKRPRRSSVQLVQCDVPGLFLCTDVIDRDAEHTLLAMIDANPWSDVLKRRVQHYGFQYNYKSRNLAPAPAPPIPDLCLQLATDLRGRCGVPGLLANDRQFDQLIVNEYLPGQGISAHTDAAVFGDCIVSVSLGSGVTMRFSRADHVHVDVWLPPRSAVFLTGDARRLWKHAIAAVKSDKGHGARARRVSLTFRTLLSLDRAANKSANFSSKTVN
jgi:alkylated DNA repair dioxygenase AlkB